MILKRVCSSLALLLLISSALLVLAEDQTVQYRFGGAEESSEILAGTDGDLVSKPWTHAERKLVEEYMSSCVKRYPALVRRCGLLSLIRVKRLKGITLAATVPNAILFADNYFALTNDEQLDTLLHELVHASDMGNLISNSEDWVRYAKAKALTFSDKAIREPSLNEKLAIYFADYAMAKRIPEQVTFQKKILPMILRNSSKDFEFNRLCCMGRRAQSRKEYALAVQCYSNALKLCETAFVHRVLGECHAKLGKYAEALEQNTLSLESYKRSGVPTADSDFMQGLKDRAFILCASGRYQDAKLVCSEYLTYRPSDNFIRKIASICNGKLTPRQ